MAVGSPRVGGQRFGFVVAASPETLCGQQTPHHVGGLFRSPRRSSTCSVLPSRHKTGHRELIFAPWRQDIRPRSGIERKVKPKRAGACLGSDQLDHLRPDRGWQELPHQQPEPERRQPTRDPGRERASGVEEVSPTVSGSSGSAAPRSVAVIQRRLHRHRGWKTRCPGRSPQGWRARPGRLAAWPGRRSCRDLPAGDQNA